MADTLCVIEEVRGNGGQHGIKYLRGVVAVISIIIMISSIYYLYNNTIGY